MATKSENKQPTTEPATTEASEAPAEVKNKPKYDPDELIRIFDEIIFSGEYEETIDIKGRLKVTFRSRSAEDTTAISRDIDIKNFSLISTLQEHRALLNLAYSITSYAGKDFKGMEVSEKQKFISKLPAVMVGALSEELGKFDSKVQAACMEGTENF